MLNITGSSINVLVVSDIVGSIAIATSFGSFAALKSVAGVAETADEAKTDQPTVTVTFDCNEDVPDHSVNQPTNCSGGLNPLSLYTSHGDRFVTLRNIAKRNRKDNLRKFSITAIQSTN